MMSSIYLILDAGLIFFFRLSDIPIVGYYVGCLILSGFCVVLGQTCKCMALHWNQESIQSANHTMVRMHNGSIKALMVRDKKAFKSCNRAANEAFGKVFFSQIGLSLSSLWPVPFAAAWLQTRFDAVAFPLPVTLPWIGGQVGYMFTFLPIYILVYIVFNAIKRCLPYRGSVVLNRHEKDSNAEKEMLSVSDLLANG